MIDRHQTNAIRFLSGHNSTRMKSAANTTEARYSDRYSDSIGVRYSIHNAVARIDKGAKPPIYRPGSRHPLQGVGGLYLLTPMELAPIFQSSNLGCRRAFAVSWDLVQSER